MTKMTPRSVFLARWRAVYLAGSSARESGAVYRELALRESSGLVHVCCDTGMAAARNRASGECVTACRRAATDCTSQVQRPLPACCWRLEFKAVLRLHDMSLYSVQKVAVRCGCGLYTRPRVRGWLSYEHLNLSVFPVSILTLSCPQNASGTDTDFHLMVLLYSRIFFATRANNA